MARAKRQGKTPAAFSSEPAAFAADSAAVDRARQWSSSGRAYSWRFRTCRTRVCRSGRALRTTSCPHVGRAYGVRFRAAGALDLGPALGFSISSDATKGSRAPGLRLSWGCRRAAIARALIDFMSICTPANRLSRSRAAISRQSRIARRHASAAEKFEAICQDRRGLRSVSFRPPRWPPDQSSRGEILNARRAAAKYVAYTQCFRSEAGRMAPTFAA